MKNEIGAEESDSTREICDVCDTKFGKFKVVISSRMNPENRMEAIFCADCFEEFLVDCDLLIGNSETEEDDNEPK